jgi:hypothetical protein
LRHDRRNPTIIERRPRSVSDDPLASQLLVELSDIKTNVVRPKARPEDRSVEALVLDARLGEIAYTEMRCAIVHEGRLGAGGHGFDLGSESADAPTYLSDVFGVPPSIGFSPRYMVKIIHACIRGFDAEASAAHVDPVPKPHGPIDLDDDG